MEMRALYVLCKNASSYSFNDVVQLAEQGGIKTALAQMQGYPATDILSENIRMVQEAINKEDVQY